MSDEDEKAAFLGAVVRSQTMADSTLRITVDLSPGDAIAAFGSFGTPGSPVAVARIANEVAVEADRPKAAKGPYGEYAKKLVQSGFFRAPEVWEALGTDKEYLEWVRSQKSAYSGRQDFDAPEGIHYCVAAHVRHVEYGSGTGIKPTYSAIPLTDDEHKLAHQKGDSELGDRDWWDKMRIKYVSQWAYETLKEKMFYDSYTHMPPSELVEWCSKRELTQYLPLAYINATMDEETSEA